MTGRLHPVWFWRATFETFCYSGIRLNQLLYLRIKGSESWREYSVPISEELRPWLERLQSEALKRKMQPHDQAFNINRLCFPTQRYCSALMTSDQVGACYTDLSSKAGFKVSPHRFRHTIDTDLMHKPEANLHLVKAL